jgi:hypothetical protein
MAKGYERFEIEKSHEFRKALILQRLLQAHQKLTGHEWTSPIRSFGLSFLPWSCSWCFLGSSGEVMAFGQVLAWGRWPQYSPTSL